MFIFFLKADLNEQKTLKFSLIKHKILNGTLMCTFLKPLSNLSPS